MSTAEAQVGERTFEQRRFEQLRREQALGRAAVAGYERRRFDEVASGLAEALSGAVDTHYTFDLQDGYLVAEDGEVIEEMLVRGLRKDIKLASSDPFYQFVPQRARAELDNFRQAQAMARGETNYNTLLEISPLTEELDTSPGNRENLIKAAQKPYWGRSMIRVSHWDGQKMHIFTRSTDNITAAENYDYSGKNSSVGILKEAVQSKLDYQYKARNSGEMLAEAIPLNNKDDSWQDLAKDLSGEVDKILTQRHGGEWRQGRPAAESVDLQKYVESQAEVMQGLFKAEARLAQQYANYEDYKKAFEREMFNCIALLEKRLETGRVDEKIVDYDAAASGAGDAAAAEGKAYDMCGTIISANQNNVAQQTGSESLMRLADKKVHCPECSKEVIVPKSDLKNGKLSCSDCGYWLDVCTGSKGFSKKESVKRGELLSGFEIISAALRRYDTEAKIKRNAEKQAKAELGDDATYLDIKRREKQLRKVEGLAA